MTHFYLYTHLGIKFLLQKVTSWYQPADMRIIASLKVGYKALYIQKLLGFFDTPGGFERAAVARKRKRRGWRGIEYGDKPHLLGCIIMLQQVYNGGDGKYVSDEISFHFWRKVYILPVTCNADINNNVGSATLAHRKNVIGDDLCNKVYNLMSQVKLKLHPLTGTYIVPAVFHSSFVVDHKFSTKDI